MLLLRLYLAREYHLRSEGASLASDALIAYYQDLIRHYPIVSIEDGLDEHDGQDGH